MSPISATSSAILGIRQNVRQLDEAATRIAHQPLGTDLAADVVQLKVAKHGVAANAAVLRTANQISGTLIDIFA